MGCSGWLVAAFAAAAGAALTTCVPARPLAPGHALVAGFFNSTTRSLVAQLPLAAGARDVAFSAADVPPACAAARGACVVRAFAGAAPSYTWEGVVGNSGPQVGFDVWRFEDLMADFAISGDLAVAATTYEEFDSSLLFARLGGDAGPRPGRLGHGD